MNEAPAGETSQRLILSAYLSSRTCIRVPWRTLGAPMPPGQRQCCSHRYDNLAHRNVRRRASLTFRCAVLSNR